MAEVEGSEFEPYQVSIRVHDGGVADAHCTCPYDWGGYCKHIVVVLLKFADANTKVVERKPLAQLLAGLDQARFIELLPKRAERDPELRPEQTLAATGTTSSTAISSSSARSRNCRRAFGASELPPAVWLTRRRVNEAKNYRAFRAGADHTGQCCGEVHLPV